MPTPIRPLLAAVLCALAACASTPLPPIPQADAGACGERRVDRLLFGLNAPDGPIDEADWRRFLADTVTPRFPDGLTVYETRGQWRGEDGRIQGEHSRAVEIVHAGDPAALARIAEIADEYKRRYRQEAVLVISHAAMACFY